MNYINMFISSLGAIFTPIRLVVLGTIIFAMWFFALGDHGIYELRQLLKLETHLMQQRQQLNDDIDELNALKQQLSQPEQMEMIIRQDLGYIKPGEIIFEEK